MNTAVSSFRLRELFPIGKGGMGTTYLACTSATGQFERLVVVKRLHEHLLHDAEAKQRFLDEADLAGCVHHANVVGVQHVGIDDRGLFLVLDFVDGTSLRKLIRARRPERLPEPIALRIIVDALSGLEAIHAATDHQGVPLDILHRDVTPENILIGRDGVARLADFGIAKSVRSTIETGPLKLVGKLPFMAPEYIDRGQVGPSLDIYAMGVSLWRLLAGRPPWESLEEAQLLVRILTEGVPDLPDDVEIGADLRAIVARACALDPAERYQSAAEMIAALEEVRSAHPLAEQGLVGRFVRESLENERPSIRERAAGLIEAKPVTERRPLDFLDPPEPQRSSDPGAIPSTMRGSQEPPSTFESLGRPTLPTDSNNHGFTREADLHTSPIYVKRRMLGALAAVALVTMGLSVGISTLAARTAAREAESIRAASPAQAEPARASLEAGPARPPSKETQKSQPKIGAPEESTAAPVADGGPASHRDAPPTSPTATRRASSATRAPASPSTTTSPPTAPSSTTPPAASPVAAPPISAPPVASSPVSEIVVRNPYRSK